MNLTKKQAKAIILFFKKFMNLTRYDQVNLIAKLEKEFKKKIKEDKEEVKND